MNLIKTTIYQTKSEYQSDNSVNPALLWDIKMKVQCKRKIDCICSSNYVHVNTTKLSPMRRISFTKNNYQAFCFLFFFLIFF